MAPSFDFSVLFPLHPLGILTIADSTTDIRGTGRE